MIDRPISELEGVRAESLVVQRSPDLTGSDVFRDLADYWSSKRGSSDVPLRTDIDPVDLKSHLSNIFIVKHIPKAADFHIRLLGTFLVERYGLDVTGSTVREAFSEIDPAFCEAAIGALTTSLKDRVIIRGQGTITSDRGTRISAEVLLLPLSSTGEQADTILGRWDFGGVLYRADLDRIRGATLL